MWWGLWKHWWYLASNGSPEWRLCSRSTLTSAPLGAFSHCKLRHATLQQHYTLISLCLMCEDGKQGADVQYSGMRRDWHLQTAADHTLLALFLDLCRCVQPKHDWYLLHVPFAPVYSRKCLFSFILGWRLLSLYNKEHTLWVSSTFSKTLSLP